MDGPQFAAAYRALPASPYPPARVIVVTASNDLAGRCRRVQADGCVGKPFDLDELLDLVLEPHHAHAHAHANQLAS
jgi:CheY-like chemotaxis protein